MLPGPSIPYKCPKCRHILLRGSFLSANTIGIRFYSDGSYIAPMHPEFPKISKCNKCNEIFWLKKPMPEKKSIIKTICSVFRIDLFKKNNKSKNKVALSHYANDHAKWRNVKNVSSAKFLDIEDYFRALHKGLAKIKSEEIYLRQRIWWAYNDRVRNSINQFNDANDEIRWKENCIKLISLYDESSVDQIFKIAELKRNLGDFEGCIETVNKIDDEKQKLLKDILISECEKRNKLVVDITISKN